MKNLLKIDSSWLNIVDFSGTDMYNNLFQSVLYNFTERPRKEECTTDLIVCVVVVSPNFFF